MKKEYTRKIKNIWQAFYDHDEKRISQIQKEILLRLNKYCDFINDRFLQSDQFVNDDDYYERSAAITRRLIDYYNLPKKIWVPDLLDVGIIPKSRIRLYERYVINNYCKGIFAKGGDYDWGLGFEVEPIFYMDRWDDLDLLYIFFGVPLEAAYDWPKSFYYFGRGFTCYQVLDHIENRKRWKEGFSEEEWNNGNLCTSGHYVNGLPNGVWKLVSPDGKKHHFIEWKEGYINGINYFYDQEVLIVGYKLHL